MTLQDYLNLRKLLDRVEVKGVAEARVVAVLAAKLEALIQEAQSGEDVHPASQ